MPLGAARCRSVPLGAARCRSPLSFIISRWHGPAPQSQSFMLWLRHGLFCVGCCRALMLMMFVAAAMAIEKNVPWDGACRHRWAWRCWRVPPSLPSCTCGA
ncbi:DUF2182 domain-containing protein [Ralstonia sp. SET104]|uniref:copper chaperone n=1 Tax=Ralstonia sp. SET104 TaxID=2448774 RepID=UPI0035B55D52